MSPIQGRDHPRAGDFIRRLRQHRHISGRSLAARAGLSPGYVSKVELGALDPSLSCFARLALALNLSPLEIWVMVRTEAVTPPLYSGDSHQAEEVSACGSVKV